MVIMAVMMVFAGTAGLADDTGSMEIDPAQHMAANLFLSNFTEIGTFDYIACHSDDIDLVDFAHDHMWFNSNNSFEYGEYFDGNNCRVSDENIQNVIDSYFLYPHQVDLSETRYDYDGEYYYSCETGGFVHAGFAYVVNVFPMEENTYFMSFVTFGGGNEWGNEVMSMSLEEIEEKYGDHFGCGSALVYSEDLSDRDTYKLVSLGVL